MSGTVLHVQVKLVIIKVDVEFNKRILKIGKNGKEVTVKGGFVDMVK